MDELLYWSGRRMRLDEFLHGDLTGERLPTTWVSSHQLVYQADDGGLLALDTFNNSLTVLVTNHTLVSTVSSNKCQCYNSSQLLSNSYNHLHT